MPKVTGSSALARRYARALLDVATTSEAPVKTAPETLRSEIDDAGKLLLAHKDLRTVLTHPAVSLDKKKKVVTVLWGRRKASPLFLRLLDLLVARDRILMLPAIGAAFTDLWNAQRGVIAAEAVSAVALEGRQRSALREALGQATGLEVELRDEVDPSVLGGLLVRMGGKTYDGTVRTQLHALRQRLLGA